MALVLYIIFLVALIYVLHQIGMSGVRNGIKTGVKAIDDLFKR
ncbi:MAG: hypothetical protein WCY13_05600 [Candidatus Cloacimonadaceae bacterium]